ncbi:hypothetical protein NIES80_02610 [Dolichospermum planctonicum]|uniref:Uncharacterized protein n=1 Tax=Dolichospermum planctonicum TaxID=136072 RepID=A0A480AA06_9CYAN|nr:hypothetical protein NIES80_02610 [Dolichospermum planctonicum]
MKRLYNGYKKMHLPLATSGGGRYLLFIHL